MYRSSSIWSDLLHRFKISRDQRPSFLHHSVLLRCLAVFDQDAVWSAETHSRWGVWEFHAFTSLFSAVHALLDAPRWALPPCSCIAALSYSHFIVSLLPFCISFLIAPPSSPLSICPPCSTPNLQTSISPSSSSLFISIFKPTTWWGSFYSFMLHPSGCTAVCRSTPPPPVSHPPPTPPPGQTALLSAGSRVPMTSSFSPLFLIYFNSCKTALQLLLTAPLPQHHHL